MSKCFNARLAGASPAALMLAIAAGLFGAPLTAHAQAVPTPDPRQYGLAMIGAPAAWALGFNGTGVIVAVGDTGFDTAHPAFAGKIDPRSLNYVLTAPGAAYNSTLIDEQKPDSHGTHVAGTIVASGTSGGPGVAFGATFVALRVLSPCKDGENCTPDQFPQGPTTASVEAFTNMANVLLYNASYGPDLKANDQVAGPDTISQSEADAVLAALRAGKIIIVANGNDRDKAPIAGRNPSGLPLFPFIRPANANTGVYNDGGRNRDFSALLTAPGQVVAVTAVGQDKTIAYYAQMCGVAAAWCVAAPGGDQQKDAGIWATLPPKTFGYLQGTSMATPMTTGALAVLQQAYPMYVGTPRDLTSVLFATAENIGGTAGVNSTYGYGLIRLDRALAGPATLAAGSTVDVATQQMTYWSQPLTTGGGFTKTGAGYLMIAGKTVATGDVSVTGGALGVGGTLTLNTQMNVAQGAMLAGFGRIVGNVAVAGTLDAGQLPNYADVIANSGGALPAAIPTTGASVGTLTVAGRMTLTATATTRMDIDGRLVNPGGPGTWDKIVVTGAGSNFTAAGALTPILRGIVGGNNNFSPTVGNTFAFITAENGGTITGEFAGITQPAAGLAPNTRLDVVYGASAITINVTALDLSAVPAADGRNQNVQNVANAIDAIRPAPGARSRNAGLTSVLNDLYDDTTAELDTGFEDLSGEGQAANAGVALAAFTGFSNVIGSRQAMTSLNYQGIAMEDDPARPQAAMLAGTGWTSWVQGAGRWTELGDDAGLPGSHSGSIAFAFGLDRAFADDLRIGGAFGYARTTTTSFDEMARADSYAGALYASWTPGAWVFDARLAGGPTRSNTERVVVVLGVPTLVTGAANGWGTLLALQGGYRFAFDGFTLQPFAGVTGQINQRDAFAETAPFGLTFPSQTFSRATIKVGAEAATSFEVGNVTIVPRISGAWTHDLGDNGLVTHAAIFDSPFVIDAADPGRDAALVGAELGMRTSDWFSLYVGYTGDFRRNGTSHEINGGLRLTL